MTQNELILTEMMMGNSPKCLEWAAVALAAHRDEGGIEGDDDIQIWHLLLSLLVFCEANGINFDETLSDARQHLAEHGP